MHSSPAQVCSRVGSAVGADVFRPCKHNAPPQRSPVSARCEVVPIGSTLGRRDWVPGLQLPRHRIMHLLQFTLVARAAERNHHAAVKVVRTCCQPDTAFPSYVRIDHSWPKFVPHNRMTSVSFNKYLPRSYGVESARVERGIHRHATFTMSFVYSSPKTFIPVPNSRILAQSFHLSTSLFNKLQRLHKSRPMAVC